VPFLLKNGYHFLQGEALIHFISGRFFMRLCRFFVVPLALLAVAVSVPQAVQAQTITDIVLRSGEPGSLDFNPFDYDILREAVLFAELGDALANEEASLTVFAPNDLAFIRTARDLGYRGFSEAGALEFIVGAFDKATITNILLYHVSGRRLGPFQVIFSRDIPTLLEGASIRPRFFRLRDNDPDIADPYLFAPINIRASNGVIHTISRVLIPVDLP
jgi:uncharacterized surface protein with fasciclin (FAS1) repeats